MRFHIRLAAVAVALSFAALSFALVSPASAIFYGANLSDPAGTVSFLNVQDINGLYGGPLDQFGQPSGPTVSLNSIDFTPIDFEESCSFCSTPQTTTDTVSFEIDAVTGQAISTIDIAETGNYELLGVNGFAQVTISATVTIDVFEVNGVGVTNVSETSQLSFVFDNGNALSGTGFVSGIFNGSLMVDVDAILAANGFGAGDQATHLLFTMDNTLTALHIGDGGQALIRKRDFDATTITINGGNPVPEPGTALLLGLGLAGLAGQRPRRAATA